MKKKYPFAIKNWKKPEQYPDSRTMSKQELAWEFIRRNPDYQSNCDDLKEANRLKQYGEHNAKSG